MKLTETQRAYVISVMVDQEIQNDCSAGGGLIGWLLTNGYKGYKKMTDEELVAECNDLLGEEWLDEYMTEQAHAGQMEGLEK